MFLGERHQQGHRAYKAEHRETVRIDLDYALSSEKGDKLEAGCQYHSYPEDDDYDME